VKPIPRLARNAGAATLQVLASGVLLFLLYGFLLRELGIEQLGLWSVVLSVTAVARITELGFTGGAVKFVAQHVANGDLPSASRAVETALLVTGAFVAVLLLVAWQPVAWALAWLLPDHALDEGRTLLPYALAALWFTTLGGICQSALDGCLRTDLRVVFAVTHSAMFLLLALLLVPVHGLLGLAWTQLGLSVLLALANWTYLRRELRHLSWAPRRLDREQLGTLARYGLNLQTGTMLQLLTDPVTKALLSRFGGLALVGFYEMASRMLMQLRALLVSPNQLAVPLFAQLKERADASIDDFYRRTYQLQAYLALPFYAGIAALLPAVSRLWLGQVEPVFIAFSLLLTLGWFLNGFVNPAYFAWLGLGRPGWNTVSHGTMAVLNVVLGLAAGALFGGEGVVGASVVALVLGSAVVLVAFHRERGLPLREAWPRGCGWLGASCATGIVVAWMLTAALEPRVSPIVTLLVVAAVYAAIVALPAWRHPVRAQLQGWLSMRGGADPFVSTAT
jgi:O-antigen/teichoic acid export membrane protein